MNATVRKQIEEVQQMTVKQLHAKYQEVFGEESRSNHRQFLVRRIAWRLQALAEGDLSERARRRTSSFQRALTTLSKAPATTRTPSSSRRYSTSRSASLSATRI